MPAEFACLQPNFLPSAGRGRIRRCVRLCASALAGLSMLTSATSGQQQSIHQMSPYWNQVGTSGDMQQRNESVPVQPAQYSFEQPPVSGQIDAVHSPNVERMLQPQYKMELEKRHSQLVITNKNIRRIALTDSTTVNYVQYSPTELSVVGLELGKTDLTLWFEGDSTPAIYEITVTRDQSLEEQRTIDFGRLERRMTDLFPNSRVYLIPVGNQVVVQGQAYDAEEAQHILQIVRSEVVRTLGRLGDLDDTGGNFALVAGGGGAGGAGGGVNGQFGNQGFRDIVVNRLTVP